MYRKAQYILMVVALTMSMLLLGIGPAQAHDDDDDDGANNCLLGILCLFDDDSTFGDSIFSLGD